MAFRHKDMAMSINEPAADKKNNPDASNGTMKRAGGSQFEDWNSTLVLQTLETIWLEKDKNARDAQEGAAFSALIGIGPKDEIEGMIAAQLIAAHNAAMECYRRAMIAGQTFEGRRENLTQANKLSRTYATLLDALNRHRGKGQQKVTVEHVHVHAGGQAVVGMVAAQGGGDRSTPGDQTHAKQIAYAPQPTMRSADTERQPVPVTSDAKWSVPDARRNVTRSPEGE
jgi:hypothetical protein